MLGFARELGGHQKRFAGALSFSSVLQESKMQGKTTVKMQGWQNKYLTFFP